MPLQEISSQDSIVLIVLVAIRIINVIEVCDVATLFGVIKETNIKISWQFLV